MTLTIDESQSSVWELYSAEMAKGEHADFDKMSDYASCIVILTSHSMANADHANVRKMAARIDILVIELRKTHNSFWTVTLTTISGLFSIGGGVCGILPLAGSLIATQHTLDQLGKVSGAMGGIGQGTGAFNKIFEETSSGARTELTHKKDMTKQIEEDWRSRRQRIESTSEKATRSRDAIIDAQHRAKAAIFQ